MADDKVVRLVFERTDEGWKSQSPADDAPAPADDTRDVSDDYKHIGPLTGEALLRAQTDLVYMLAQMEFVQQMRDKLEKATDLIHSLPNFVIDQESIRLRRLGLKNLSLEEICKLTDATHELQWRRQPSYLGALMLEHHYRVQAGISLMPSDEEPENNDSASEK